MTALSAGMTREQAAEPARRPQQRIRSTSSIADCPARNHALLRPQYDPENYARSSGASWAFCIFVFRSGLGRGTTYEPRMNTPPYTPAPPSPLIEERAARRSSSRHPSLAPHTSDYNTDLPKPELQMEKILFATEPRADGPHRRGHHHAPEQVGHGLQREVAHREEVTRTSAPRRRREPRGHRLRAPRCSAGS